MTEPHPAVRRTWRTRLPVSFSHFVLFDFSGHSSPVDLNTTLDSHWIGQSGPGGALFHTADTNLEAEVLVELHDTEPEAIDTSDHSYTGGFHTASGSLLLAASTGSPDDTPIDLPAPGDYTLTAHRLPEAIDTSFGDEARCEQWIIRLWPSRH